MKLCILCTAHNPPRNSLLFLRSNAAVHTRTEQKDSILTQYTTRSAGETVNGFLVCGWLKHWDGMAASLKRTAVPGKPRLLSSAQVRRHVATRIRSSNRSGRPVRYTQLLGPVQQTTGKQVSIQTLRRYGRQELHASQTRGKKRTADEGMHTFYRTRLHTTARSSQNQLLDVLVVGVHFSVSAQMCEQIAKIRRKLQCIGANHILVVDKT